VRLDMEREKEISRLMKEKLDKEIELRNLHSMKRVELGQKEVDTCLQKLNEIEAKISKSNQVLHEKQEERTAFLKT